MEKEYRLIGHGNKSTKFVLDHDDEYIVDFEKWDEHYRVGFETNWKVDPIYVDPQMDHLSMLDTKQVTLR